MRHALNFHIYYEIDDETVSTVLRLDEYGGQEEKSWVLLAEDEVGGSPP